MTGIERLREIVREFGDVSFCYGLYLRLADVADQIEREQNEMVADSPYDALRPDDRKAIAWVRDHGGLEEVEAHWSGRVPLTSVKRMVELHKSKRERLKAHISSLERVCAERRDKIIELRKTIAEMRPRLMPEGMEWPRYEDGEPVRIGDVAVLADNEPHEVESMEFFADKSCKLKGKDTPWMNTIFKGQVAKRPEPKVLDADGAEVRVGDTVYEVDTGEQMWVCALPKQGEYSCVKLRLANGMSTALDPCRLTHERPVLDADGVQIKVGDTVYDRDSETDTPLTVVDVSSDLVRCEYRWKDGKTYRPCYPPSALTHTKPEIDTWERLEEDANNLIYDIGSHLGDYSPSCFNETGDSVQDRVRDLVRRARTLAGDA